MIAERVLGNISGYKGEKEVIPIFFEWFEMDKKRISKTAADGEKFGIGIEEGIQPGDIVGESESAIYVIQVKPSRQIKIQVHSMKEMGRLGFELGNRHLSLKMTENEVYVPYDEPTFEYLKKLGFCVEEVTEVFTDFIVCKGHGHSHSHGTHEGHVHG